MRDRGRGERSGELAPQLGAARRRERVDQPVGLLGDRRAEALAHGVEPERPRERVAMALVRRALERQHARPDDLPGREARILDRERLRVAHHAHRQVAARHQPAVQRRQPGHRLVLAQAREHGVWIGLQLRERHRRADRERGGAHRTIIFRVAGAP